MTLPQSLASLRSAIYTPIGDIISEEEVAAFSDSLPALVLNSGYHTMEQVAINSFFREMQPIQGTAQENFSMEHIDELTLAAVLEAYGDRLARKPNIIDINNALNGHFRTQVRYIGEDGSRMAVDLKPFHENALKAEYERLTRYISSRYEPDVLRSIYLTGGTSEELYRLMEKDYARLGFDRCALLTGKLYTDNGTKDVGVVAAVAFGAYGELATTLAVPYMLGVR